MKYVIYDIETLRNCITFCFLDYETRKKKSFVFYNDITPVEELLKFLRGLYKHDYYLVGFNNLYFDAQIIEHFIDIAKDKSLTIEEIISSLYNKAQFLIKLTDEEKWRSTVHESRLTLKNIDLYKQKHYDRPQKATSLKWLEFTMRRRVIKEMPISHDTLVTEEQIPIILDYNWEDVDATCEFLEKIMFETTLRFSLSDKFNLKLLNAPEPRIAREIFGKFLSEEMKIKYSELKEMRTIRDFSTVASLSSIITESDSSPVPTKEGRVLGIKTSSGDIDEGMIEEM